MLFVLCFLCCHGRCITRYVSFALDLHSLLFIFRSVCKYDKRMPEFLRSHCDHVDVKDTSSCQCSDIPIDCNDLDKITPSQREAMKKFHSESSSPPSSTKRKEDSSKPGKIKQKNKMWDEL